MKRAALRVAAAAALALAIVGARIVWSSRVEWRDGEARAAALDEPGALDHLGRAARLYAPGNPYSRRALDRIEELARADEAAGRRTQALTAWRELRSSVLATRAAYAPNAARRTVADGRIAELAAALESPAIDPTADEAGRRAWHAARLAQTEEPSVGWSLAAVLGFALWIGCAFGFFLRAVDERDRLRRRAALLWGAGLAAGIALSLFALARA